MEIMEYIWLAVTIIAAIVEAAGPSLVSIWFVPGGIAALAASLLGGKLWLQIALFLAVTCAALIATRPLAKKFHQRQAVRTNADMVLGKTGVITEDVDNVLGEGRATVMGNSWSARSDQPDGKIPKGAEVRVERIEGVKLIVSVMETERGEDVK